MATPFGPQLIGETEKTLNAMLRVVLADSDLSEPHWVALRIASTAAAPDADSLVRTVKDRAHFLEADRLVAALHERGLLVDGRITDRGTALIGDAQARIRDLTAPVWTDLPPEDVAATERTLNTVLTRARTLV